MNYENLTEIDIFEKGYKDSDFDYDKGLDVLIEIDKTGEWIYWAGREWKEFNYKKGLKYLLKIKFNCLEDVFKYWKFPKEKLSNEEVLEFINLI